jgi:hypothetical protein
MAGGLPDTVTVNLKIESVTTTGTKDFSLYYTAPLDPVIKDGACEEQAGQAFVMPFNEKRLAYTRGCI